MSVYPFFMFLSWSGTRVLPLQADARRLHRPGGQTRLPSKKDSRPGRRTGHRYYRSASPERSKHGLRSDGGFASVSTCHGKSSTTIPVGWLDNCQWLQIMRQELHFQASARRALVLPFCHRPFGTMQQSGYGLSNNLRQGLFDLQASSFKFQNGCAAITQQNSSAHGCSIVGALQCATVIAARRWLTHAFHGWVTVTECFWHL